MSFKGPVRVSDRHAFDTIIDARSPAEFAQDHLPGAINCPVLDDEERRIVGTLYKQQGAFEARRVGGAMVAANLARHLREQFADRPTHWKPLVYCWRGGMRSGSMVTWLRLVGWDAQQLAGGYKSWRHHVMQQLQDLAGQLQLQVVCGPTGSGKTRVLHALQDQGQQVLDLEALACHRGSLLGAWPGVAQPSQTAFETRIVHALEALDLSRPVWVEAESARIGRVNVPPPLVERLRSSPCIEIQAPAACRLQLLLQEYSHLGDDVDHLMHQLHRLKELHGKAILARWEAWARQGQLEALFAELMSIHYDPLYERSQKAHLRSWEQRRQLPIADLNADAVQVLAQAMVQTFTPLAGADA